MSPTLAPPDEKIVAERLASLLVGPGGGIEVVERTPTRSASSFPSEVVRCRLPDGREVHVFCKYAAGYSHGSYGHRAGVAYEATVYERLLAPLGVSVPHLVGVHREREEEAWLVLEHLGDAEPLDWRGDDGSLHGAAGWIGRFHALAESRAGEPSLGFLERYDADYYRGWCRRTAGFRREVGPGSGWVASLCRRAEAALIELLEPPLTVIHGELYPANVLVSGRGIHPVDWETAAVAAGEIDLAMLTQGWSRADAGACEAAYVAARWPGGEPRGFHRRLLAARLYAELRWLGEEPDWATHPGADRRFTSLHELGARLGLV